MGIFLWWKFLKTNGENIVKCMFFIVFSSAIFLERPNHKVISVWTQQGLSGQSPICGVTKGCWIFEARSLLSSYQVVIDPHMILAAMLWTN